jgi:ABC-2 type transport system ATP-binding protein
MTKPRLSAVPRAVLATPILQSEPLRTSAAGRFAAVRVDRLRKSYGPIEAVAGLSFEINAGEVFGLLGPNGAGKTTTISVLATRLRPSAGDAVIFGHSVRANANAVRRMIGVVSQDVAVYPTLTAAENVDGRRDDYVNTFSGGMKRRLNLAMSLVHRPKLILLDEPTVGVDPHSRKNIFEIVRHLRDAGTAILYTTHYMEEAERLCDRLGIMDEGKIIAMGTLDVLLANLGCAEVIEVRGLPPGTDLSGLQTAAGVCRLESQNGTARLFVTSAARVLGPLHQAIARYSERVYVEIAPLSLENLFLQLTGKELRD